MKSAQASTANKHFNYVNATRIKNRKGWVDAVLGTAPDLLQSIPGSAGGRSETFHFFTQRDGRLREANQNVGEAEELERGLTMWTAIIWQAWIMSVPVAQRY